MLCPGPMAAIALSTPSASAHTMLPRTYAGKVRPIAVTTSATASICPAPLAWVARPAARKCSRTRPWSVR